jgi:hypothetical protein
MKTMYRVAAEIRRKMRPFRLPTQADAENDEAQAREEA